MGAQIKVVIVEVDDSLNGASTGKITIQKLVILFMIFIPIDFYGLINFLQGQEADNLELGES